MRLYFKIHKRKLFLYLLASATYAIILASTGFIYSMLTSAALGNNLNHFLKVAIFAVAFLLLDSFFDFVPRYTRANLINRMLDSLRNDLVTHYLTENLQDLMNENPSERTNKLVNNLEVIENSYLKPLLSSFTSLFVFIF